MKNYLLLASLFLGCGFYVQSQVVVAGVSPASIQGNYDFTVQANCGAWPGETDDGTWDVLSNLDFNIPGTFIQDTLMLVEDGEPGTNPQGNPISQEGCNPLTNDLTGKIAVIYRNTCEFGTKILNAQNAGAVAAIIVNREDALLGMLGGVDGLNVSIPAVFLSSIDGQALISEMSNGPVEVFIGNKIGAFANDVGSDPGATLISPYGGQNSALINGFDLGIEIYNYGSNDQSSVTVTALIDGPAGNVYNQTISVPTMLSGDTVSIFNGNTLYFNPFSLSSYPNGDYTLRYAIDLGVADDFSFDNDFTSSFTVDPRRISLSRIDGAGMPIATSYPSNTEGEYQGCMFFEEPNASNVGVQGVYFVPHTDTSVNQLAGAEIIMNVYHWDDPWTDLSDPAYATAANNDWFQNLTSVAYETYYPASNDETDDVAYIPFTTPFILADNQRYLFCLQTYDPAISFGYDNALNYDANQAITAMPISTVLTETAGATTWYTGGWNSFSATSMALNTFDPADLGIGETNAINGLAYPNPAKDVVTLSVSESGSGTLTVTDVSGKVAAIHLITLIDGKTKVDISSLDPGVYVFRTTLDSGKTAQFNVIKK